eukprot:3927768-Heterocapsa_arctica.AAC.1
MPCALTPDIALYMSFRAAVSVGSRNALDVFPRCGERWPPATLYRCLFARRPALGLRQRRVLSHVDTQP